MPIQSLSIEILRRPTPQTQQEQTRETRVSVAIFKSVSPTRTGSTGILDIIEEKVSLDQILF